MSANIHSVEYYFTIVEDEPGQACRLLERLASEEVNLLAFTALPAGPKKTQLVIYPLSSSRLARVANKSGLILQGPHRAFLIQGDDELGALVDLHQRLCDAKINVISSSGVSDGKGGYGYILQVRGDEFAEAERALGL